MCSYILTHFLPQLPLAQVGVLMSQHFPIKWRAKGEDQAEYAGKEAVQEWRLEGIFTQTVSWKYCGMEPKKEEEEVNLGWEADPLHVF